VIAFGLLYWELDSGGPAQRAHGLPACPDFAFPQQLSPELAPRDWRPRFVDYLYLGFTSATAFSPPDAMPLWELGAADSTLVENYGVAVDPAGTYVAVASRGYGNDPANFQNGGEHFLGG